LTNRGDEESQARTIEKGDLKKNKKGDQLDPAFEQNKDDGEF